MQVNTQPLKIALANITEPMERLYFLPYSLGLLQSYAQKYAQNPELFDFLPAFFLREPLEQVLPRLQDADLLGCSVYVWNIRYSLALAKMYKEQNPDGFVVFGGPHVPDRADDFLRQNPFIDLAVHGEGEQVFLNVLEVLKNRPDRSEQHQHWQQFKGLSWLDASGVFQSTGKTDRITSLEQIPSPYLNGFFEPILKQFPQYRWLAIWESNRGCPFSCTFCDWGSINSKIIRFDMDRLEQEITWFGRQQIDFIYCADANFGVFPRDQELAEKFIETRKQSAYPKTVILQMTKNQVERSFQTFKRLNEAGMMYSVTLSMQSVTPAVQTAIKRDNISLDVYQQLLRRFVSEGIPTYTDILIGLPGESFDSFVDCLTSVITQGQHQELRIWNTYILPNAEMASPEYRLQYQIESVTVPSIELYLPVREPVSGIQEQIELLVATDTMPRQDWIRMRALSWLTQLIYYGKLLQIPLLLLHDLAGLSHRDMLLAFLEGPVPEGSKVLLYLRQFFSQLANEMLAGKPELVPGKDLITGTTIWLPAQTFVQQELLFSPHLDPFYAEAYLLFKDLLNQHQKTLPAGLLEQAMLLNQAIFKSQLAQHRIFELTQSYNIWGCYQQCLKSETPDLQSGHWLAKSQINSQKKLQIEELSLNHSPGSPKLTSLF